MATQNPPQLQRTARWERKHRAQQEERRAQAVLKKRKAERKAMHGPTMIRQLATRKLSSRAYLQAIESLWQATRQSKLAATGPMVRSGWPQPDQTYLFGLAQLAQRFESWIRTPEDWSPRTHNAQRQFASLARHLLCQYDVPRCFESAWTNTNRAQAKREQDWYIRLGRGLSLRGAAGLPIELTRRAAHVLPQAPADLTIRQALRWAQLQSMGADGALTEALLASTMATDFKRDDFWLTVAAFFIRHPMLDRAQVGPIVDYLHHQRHVDQPTMLVDGRLVEPGPAQPRLSMTGRSPDTLLRQVQQWHARLARVPKHFVQQSWRHCGVPGMDRLEGDGSSAVLWRIRELTDSRELLAEGKTMRHCVGSYVDSCARGFSAIYAMRKTKSSTISPVLTIEVVVKTRTIAQARGRDNARPTQEQKRVLSIWAQQAHLTIGRYV